MSIRKHIASIIVLLAATTSLAQTSETQDKPSFFASHSAKVTAIVEAIDHETRVVTLRGQEGNTVTFTASDEVRNLAQVDVGDLVSADFVETLSIEVMANNGMEPAAAEISALARAEIGELPGAAATGAQVLVATVEDINLETNTFKLKGPDGKVGEYVARNPDNLKRASVGDLVVIKTTTTVALSVEKRPAE